MCSPDCAKKHVERTRFLAPSGLRKKWNGAEPPRGAVPSPLKPQLSRPWKVGKGTELLEVEIGAAALATRGVNGESP
jgi:hypothetical protein